MKYFKRNRSRLFQATVVGMGNSFYCVHTLIPVPNQCKDEDKLTVEVNHSDYPAILRGIKNKQDFELFTHLFKRGYEPITFSLTFTNTYRINDTYTTDIYFDQFYFKRNRIKKQTSKKKRYYPRRIHVWNIIKRDLERPIS